MSSLSMQFLIKLDCIACTYFSLFFNHKINQQVWVYFLEKGGIREVILGSQNLKVQMCSWCIIHYLCVQLLKSLK